MFSFLTHCAKVSSYAITEKEGHVQDSRRGISQDGPDRTASCHKKCSTSSINSDKRCVQVCNGKQ